MWSGRSASPVEPAVTETTMGADNSILETLRQIATVVAPMPVYGWVHLPEGASVAAEWWPVIDFESPDQYSEGPTPNPRVTGIDTGQTQVQLVLEVGEGWAVLVENFRGDLGDVEGKSVGEVVIGWQTCIVSPAATWCSGATGAVGTGYSGVASLMLNW